MNKRGIAEHADFGLWAVAVAQTDGVVYNLRKVRVTGGLAITGKGDDVRQAAVGLHLPELGLESFSHLFASGKRKLRSVVGIEATLTIYTVEGAYLAVGRQQIDTKRETHPAAVHRSEDGRWITDGTHNGVQRYEKVES